MSDFNNWWAKASKSSKIGGLRGAGSCCTAGGRAKGLSKCEDKPNDPEIVRNIWHIPVQIFPQQQLRAPGPRRGREIIIKKQKARNAMKERSFDRCCLFNDQISIDLFHLRMNYYLRWENYQFGNYWILNINSEDNSEAEVSQTPPPHCPPVLDHQCHRTPTSPHSAGLADWPALPPLTPSSVTPSPGPHTWRAPASSSRGEGGHQDNPRFHIVGSLHRPALLCLTAAAAVTSELPSVLVIVNLISW